MTNELAETTVQRDEWKRIAEDRGIEIERLRAIIQSCPACSAMDGFLGVGAGPPLPSDAELRADCAHEPCEQLPVIENWAAFASESKDPAVRNMYADFKAVLQGASRDASSVPVEKSEEGAQ